jgi:hypothetical protein
MVSRSWTVSSPAWVEIRVSTSWLKTAVSPKGWISWADDVQPRMRKPSSATHCSQSARYSAVEPRRCAVVWKTKVASGAKAPK